MKQRKTTENYLKAIYLLSRTGEVHGAQLARYLEVSRPTVSVSLKELEAEGFLTLAPDKAIHLTALGTGVAQSTYEKNQMLRDFLIRLGVSEATAVKDACEMEHAVSAESFLALKQIMEDAT